MWAGQPYAAMVQPFLEVGSGRHVRAMCLVDTLGAEICTWCAECQGGAAVC